MKKYWRKIAVISIVLLLALALGLAWWGWQAGGIELLQPGLAWC
ncbi:hypothetical protein [Rheinheimera metallidurans]